MVKASRRTPLEVPDEAVRAALIPLGQAIIDAEAKLDDYPQWQVFLQKFYDTLNSIMVGEAA